MNKRISDMMDSFTDESVHIELSEQVSPERIREAVMRKISNCSVFLVLLFLLKMSLSNILRHWKRPRRETIESSERR